MITSVLNLRAVYCCFKVSAFALCFRVVLFQPHVRIMFFLYLMALFLTSAQEKIFVILNLQFLYHLIQILRLTYHLLQVRFYNVLDTLLFHAFMLLKYK